MKTRRDLTRDFQRLPSEVTRYEEPVTRATMRVAVLADVHGNRLALNAILTRIPQMRTFLSEARTRFCFTLQNDSWWE